MEGRSLRSSAGVGQEEEDEESGEEEEEGEKDTFPSWKKTIMIGPSYQASVPSGTTNYDDRFGKQRNNPLSTRKLSPRWCFKNANHNCGMLKYDFQPSLNK